MKQMQNICLNDEHDEERTLAQSRNSQGLISLFRSVLNLCKVISKGRVARQCWQNECFVKEKNHEKKKIWR